MWKNRLQYDGSENHIMLLLCFIQNIHKRFPPQFTLMVEVERHRVPLVATATTVVSFSSKWEEINCCKWYDWFGNNVEMILRVCKQCTITTWLFLMTWKTQRFSQNMNRNLNMFFFSFRWFFLRKTLRCPKYCLHKVILQTCLLPVFIFNFHSFLPIYS